MVYPGRVGVEKGPALDEVDKMGPPLPRRGAWCDLHSPTERDMVGPVGDHDGTCAATGLGKGT